MSGSTHDTTIGPDALEVGEQPDVIDVATIQRHLTKLREDLSTLCRLDDEGGAAAYVRLAGEDPMDYDQSIAPMKAVACADVARLAPDIDRIGVMLQHLAGQGDGHVRVEIDLRDGTEYALDGVGPEYVRVLKALRGAWHAGKTGGVDLDVTTSAGQRHALRFDYQDVTRIEFITTSAGTSGVTSGGSHA